MLSKRDKHRKLMQLDMLVSSGGDKNHINMLRAELGMQVDEEKLEASDLALIAMVDTYNRLRAFGMVDNEIAFVLKIGTQKVAKLRQISEDEDIEELEEHTVVKRFKKLFAKRANY